MTQKELLYVEDAVGHEDNIIKILEESISMMEDEKLMSFLEQEKKKHSTLKEKLIKHLGVTSNE